MLEGNGNGKRKPKVLDSGRISVRFTGHIDLNTLGTTIVLMGTIILLWLMVSGIFILGRG